MARRALLYLRQSDSEGYGEHSLSLDSQASVLRADAERLGWSIVAEVRDPDLKGADDQRPGLLDLYARCRAGDVDLVAFWNLERLARSVRITENVVHELNHLGVALYSNQEPWITDFPFLRQVLAAAAEQQTRTISGHVRRALRERAQRGIHHGPTPYGFRRREDGRLEPSPEADADVVRDLFRLRDEGASWAQIVNDLEARGIVSPTGLPRWHVTPIRLMLANPVYRGALRHRDLVIDHTHDPLVSDDLWWRVQTRFACRPRAPRAKADGSWLEGLIEHGCGQVMYFWRPRRDADGRAKRLRCLTSNSTLRSCEVRPHSARAWVLEAAAWRCLTSDVARVLATGPEQVLAEAQRRYRQQAPADASARREAETRQRRALARRARAEELFLSELRDRRWFDAEEARTSAELIAVEQVLAALPAAPDRTVIMQHFATLQHVVGGAAGDLSRVELPAARRRLLRELGVAVFGGANGGEDGVTIRYRAPYDLMFSDPDRP